ncbi:alpha/beta fold hydrolase [Mucilaginibacter psychrotolerans]|uniref:Alpha/beta hydrolase n=1 Tax=Mucilaginibacter psychrotolerans TaxID=1524096 RepID=A0A4Y8SNE8_9SPHI|nr:alpha/beta hydrolase [Mucilaginibacter psychrotolerans]TFF40398.1 alpha/beta hydrolase [Mucilaginibacter psychrotolerans]
MQIKHTSYFKNPEQDAAWFKNWVARLEQANNKTYLSIEIETALGKTQAWGVNTRLKDAETLVIFPGARTTSLFWDLDNGLSNFGMPLKIYLVETNGLPNLSDGGTPDIKSADYGEWAAEVLDKLNIGRAYVAGASFGGLIAMKLCITHPQKVHAAFLLNPGCLQSFSLTIKNLYYNLLPILATSEKNVRIFLDNAVFCKPEHQLSLEAEQLLVDYEVFAISRYKDNTQKPYDMDKELLKVKTPTYLLQGTADILFPHQKSAAAAMAKISNLKEVKVFNNVGHGIETYAAAIAYTGAIIKRLR